MEGSWSSGNWASKVEPMTWVILPVAGMGGFLVVSLVWVDSVRTATSRGPRRSGAGPKIVLFLHEVTRRGVWSQVLGSFCTFGWDGEVWCAGVKGIHHRGHGDTERSVERSVGFGRRFFRAGGCGAWRVTGAHRMGVNVW